MPDCFSATLEINRLRRALCVYSIMNEQEIINEFNKRKRKLTVFFAVAFALFGFPFLVNSLTEIYLNPTFSFLIGFGLISFGLYNYRCPNCNSIPPALGQPGVQLAPKECGKCGVKLR